MSNTLFKPGDRVIIDPRVASKDMQDASSRWCAG